MSSPNTTGSEKEVGEIPFTRDEVLKLGEALVRELRELAESAQEASKILHRLADEIDEFCKKCNRGRIVGSVTSLLGFPLIAVGFGLSFVTFGASLGLSIAGAALSGTGGIAAAGSGLAEHFMTKSKCSEAQEAFDSVHQKAEAYKEKLEKLKKMIPSPGVLSAVRHSSSFATNAASGVGIPVLNGIRLAAGVADDAAATVFRGLGTGFRVLHIGGFVFSAVLVPYDIYILASSSIKEHRKTRSEQANKIRELARKMDSLAQEWNAVLNPVEDMPVELDQLDFNEILTRTLTKLCLKYNLQKLE
ncbi:uncharacterized protein LOC106174983 [Lingula anatina]|uniref:Uncharacterized protein LOC106174983 n=1 Tax=Lingula anatina TaxID=7574 RepID=A0A1S3JPE9_LINAN|nr:uncharacterized protein LOC106174983 [Lingula anatina]|eukprot:XP_013412233.1 uncharacterized protein LOC106174983 [Lingula anatina]